MQSLHVARQSKHAKTLNNNLRLSWVTTTQLAGSFFTINLAMGVIRVCGASRVL